jgi:hypothetical protein
VLRRGRAEDVKPPPREGRDPRCTVGARWLDPPDLEADARDDPPLTRRFWPASVGSIAIADINAKAKNRTHLRFGIRAFTSHLQTGPEARTEQVFLIAR